MAHGTHARTNPLLVLIGSLALLSPALAAPAPATVTYEKDVRPILKKHCFQCHGGGTEIHGELDLRLQRFILKGGEKGPEVTPGDPHRSRMFEYVSAGKMPKNAKKLADADVETIRRWIEQGAQTARPEPESIADGYVTEEDREFWSFQPITRPAIPPVKHADRVQTPIDAFVLQKLEEQKLSYSPETDKRSLIRRAYFDIIGLPPTAAEVAAFVADKRDDAYERLIDRLLASPHYGERWGRHWLDVAGYADSDGYTSDSVRGDAYHYRDYVIRSFNADKPYDQFLIEQLAGDELINYPAQKLAPADADKLIATGFLRMAPDASNSPDVTKDIAANQNIADTIKIVSTAVMGLTMGCAQCHDHRFDPIPQADYYKMRAVFEPAYDWKNWRTPAARRVSLYTPEEIARAAEIEAVAKKMDDERAAIGAKLVEEQFQKELAKIPEAQRAAMRKAFDTPDTKRTPEQKTLLKTYPKCNVSVGSLYLYDRSIGDQLKAMAAESAKVRATKPRQEFVAALWELPGKVPQTFVFSRGDHEQPRREQQPGSPLVISGVDPFVMPAADPNLSTTGRRLAFARWLTDGKNPLTARVIVNRIWHHHFGRGIVATPADFGHHGDLPTHPQLLDWLASDFMANGWKIKRLHKLIMTSAAYTQASRRTPAGDEIDPDNKLLWRSPVRRLEAESVRDALLAVAGRFNDRMYGDPLPVAPDEIGQIIIGNDIRDTAGRPQRGKQMSIGNEEFRRSLYIQVVRSKPVSMLECFDGALMDPNCESRSSSTVTPQSLLMMNNEWVVTICGSFARRVMAEAGPDVRAQAIHAWRLAFGDEPTSLQVTDAIAFITQEEAHMAPANKSDPRLEALTAYCHALCSANAFLYVD